MNVVVLEGTLSSEPQIRALASGSSLHQFEVTTRVEGEPASTVPVAWFDPPASAPAFVKGAEVVVFGSIRRRFFKGGGGTQSRTEVVATEVLPAARRAAVKRLMRRQAERLGVSAGSEVRSV